MTDVGSGNAYPAIEHPLEEASLSGGMLRTGYQCHYVVTDRAGLPHTNPGGKIPDTYDEIVINQETQVSTIALLNKEGEAVKERTKNTLQVCPAYIFELEPENFGRLMEKFQRDIPVNVFETPLDISSDGSELSALL
jgi:hypothetical protein